GLPLDNRKPAAAYLFTKQFPSPRPSSRMPTLCFIIHGIGSQSQDFATPLKQGIDRELQKIARERSRSQPAEWAGIDPANLVHYHSLYWANVGTDAQANLYRRLYPDYFNEASRWKRLGNALAGFSPARDLSVNLLGDVF